MSQVVYVLQHAKDIDEEEDVKFIGVYSNSEKAEATVEKFKKIEGFKDYPEGFTIAEHELDVDGWDTGFVTV